MQKGIWGNNFNFIILKRSFLLMSFNFGVNSLVVMVVMVMIGNLALNRCSKLFTVGS